MAVKSPRKPIPPIAPRASHAPQRNVEPCSNNVLPAALRVSQIVKPHGILPISASTWWAGVKSGRYPQPIKLGPRMTAWRREDVMAMLNGESA